MITKAKLRELIPLILVFTLVLAPGAAKVQVRWNFDKGNGAIYQAGETGKLDVWVENAIDDTSKELDESRFIGNVKVKIQYPTGIDGTISSSHPATLAPGETGSKLSHTFSISPDAQQAVYSFKIEVWYDQNYTDPYKPKCCQKISIMNNRIEINGNHGGQLNYIRVQRSAEETDLTEISDKLNDVSDSIKNVENELKNPKTDSTQKTLTIYNPTLIGASDTSALKLSLASSAGAVVGAVGSIISSIWSVISAVIVGVLSAVSSAVFVLAVLFSAGLLSIVVILSITSIILSAGLSLVLLFTVVAIIDFLIVLFVVWLIIRIIQSFGKKKKKK